MNNSLLRHYGQLNRKLRIEKSYNLSNYYNLPNKPEYNIKITHKLVNENNENNENTSKIIVNMEFSSIRFLEEAENIKSIYIGLPMEINQIIAKFVPSNIFFDYKIELDYPNSYPFNPPIWYLKDIKSNMFHIFGQEYFHYLIEDHNEANKHSWAPSARLDKDVLSFYTRLNGTIEYILEKNCY